MVNEYLLWVLVIGISIGPETKSVDPYSYWHNYKLNKSNISSVIVIIPKLLWYTRYETLWDMLSL